MAQCPNCSDLMAPQRREGLEVIYHCAMCDEEHRIEEKESVRCDRCDDQVVAEVSDINNRFTCPQCGKRQRLFVETPDVDVREWIEEKRDAGHFGWDVATNLAKAEECMQAIEDHGDGEWAIVFRADNCDIDSGADNTALVRRTFHGDPQYSLLEGSETTDFAHYTPIQYGGEDYHFEQVGKYADDVVAYSRGVMVDRFVLKFYTAMVDKGTDIMSKSRCDEVYDT